MWQLDDVWQDSKPFKIRVLKLDWEVISTSDKRITVLIVDYKTESFKEGLSVGVISQKCRIHYPMVG